MKKLIFASFLFVLGLFSVTVFTSVFAQGDEQIESSLVQTLRIQAIQILIDKGFDRFETMPFGPGSDVVHLTGSQVYPEYPSYYMNTGLNLEDDLDILLLKKIENLYANRGWFAKFSQPAFDEFVWTDEEIQTLHHVYLFKTEQDLKDLGYVVSSYRTRTNNDPDRRQANIFNSYRNIGNVRVLNPDQELSFMEEIHYEANAGDHKRDLASGLANIGGLSMVKGGGICGAAWGIHATIASNKAFEINERFNHTISYNYLYENTINGQHFWVPGMDVSVYSFPGSKKDFLFKNIREYPVVLVMNFDGTDGSQEEGFVLSKEEDRGYVKYNGNVGNCYTREANGRKIKSCYRKVVK